MVQIDAADLEALKAELEHAQARHTLDELVERLVRLTLARTTGLRIYSPVETYEVGERIIFRGQPADILDVRSGGNPSQGTFQVLELKLEDGTVERVVASVPGASQSAENALAVAAVLSQAQTEALQQRLLADPEIRASVVGGSGGMDIGEVISSHRAGSGRRSAGLFAEHLVDEYLSATRELDTDLEVRGSRCLALLEGVTGQGCILPTTVRQAWHDLISPMLQVLGWRISPLESGASFGLTPDLTDPLASRLAMYDTDEDKAWAIVVPVALGWDPDCGRPEAGTDGLPPVFHLVEALWEQRARWGILTDGLTWRLYASSRGDVDVGSILNETYEVSLIATLQAPDSPAGRSALRRWLGLFSIHGWSVGQDGLALVEELKRRTARYADTVITDLQRVLWEQVVPILAGGFAAYLWNSTDPPLAPEERDREALVAALTLTHLAVALLYMEHLHLLPVTHPDYRALSMTSLVHGAAAALAEGRALGRSITKTPRYQRLLDLFGLIKSGGAMCSPDAEVQASLASALDRIVGQRLSTLRLSDEMLVRGLAPLSALDGRAIDWSALTWRHLTNLLGSLLESRLWVTDVRAGQAALVDARDSRLGPVRRVVPDSVNMTAIEHAMTSLLRERTQRYRRAMDQRLRVQTRSEAAPLCEDGVVSRDAALSVLSQEVQDALLGIRVLDPAMGAGEYLMAALDFLADGIVAAVAGYYRSRPWLTWSDDPIYHALQALVMAPQEQQSHPVHHNEIALLTAWLCEHSLYGVDLDPLATSLAQQVFAMRMGAAGLMPAHPLRFQCGDSLKAVFVADYLDDASGIASLAQEIWRELSLGLPLQQEPHMDDERETIVSLGLDLFWAYHQGLDVAVGLIENHCAELVAALRRDEALSPDLLEKLRHLRESIRDQRPMCWEAAFPEVFLRPIPDGPGFDAVIGNPPSIDVKRSSPNQVVGYSLSRYGEDSPGAKEPFAIVAHHVVRRVGGKVALVIVPPREEDG
ncbi:MAG TPA: hypothetical protein ENL34_05460 [Chloroflexi bacterium]|nr:hypothetical protein [Chloroflexota bacterium]